MPGSTPDLVAALDPARLGRFALVLVRGTEEPLYTDDRPIDAAIEALAAAGYEPVESEADEVFPFRSALLRRPAGFEAAIRAAARIAELESAEGVSAARIAELESAAGVSAARIAELEAIAAAADARVKELQPQVIDLRGRIEAARVAHVAREEELSRALQTANYQRDSLGAALTVAENGLAAAAEQGDALNARIAELEASIADKNQRFLAEREVHVARSRLADDQAAELEAVRALASGRADELEESAQKLAALSAELEAAAAQNVELATLRDQLAAQATALDTLGTRLERLQDDKTGLEEQLADKNRRFVEERAAYADTVAKQRAEAEAKITTLSDTCAKQGARVAEMEGRLEAAANRMRSLEAQLAEATREREALGAKIATADARADAAERGTRAATSQADGLRERIAELTRRLEDASDAAGLAVRLQTLRENDLDDLQRRHGTLNEAFDNQRRLLEKLAGRLVAANEYFQRLALAPASPRTAALPRTSGPAALVARTAKAVKPAQATKPAKATKQARTATPAKATKQARTATPAKATKQATSKPAKATKSTASARRTGRRT